MSERESGRGRSGESAHESSEQEAGAEDQAAAHRLLAARHRRWLQRKASRAPSATAASIPEGGGSPLAPAVRTRMEGHLGADLSAVKVHTGGESSTAAEQLGARAFATGTDIHFGAGEFAPGTKEGDRLLAHELAHTVQAQKSGVHRKADPAAHGDSDSEQAHEVSEPNDPAEKEADAVADRAADGLHGHDSDAGHEHGSATTKPAIESKPAPVGRKIYRKVFLKEEERAADKKEGETKKAKAPELKAGATGIINKEVTVKVAGKDTKLPGGTVIKVDKVVDDKQLSVKLLSGFGGKPAVIPREDFESQPGVAVDEDSGKERDDHYEEYKGALWGKDGVPTVDDIHQGYIGDCYLMAAMGAVVARNPSAIRSLFSPQTAGAPAYQVTLHVRGADGKFEKVAFSVDTKLPTQKDMPQKPAYANLNKGAAPLWPALLEKAYAMMVGGYAAAGEGGQPGNAMEALTGTAKDNEAMPDKDKMVEQFKNYEKQGKAVNVSTRGEMKQTKQTPFAGKGDKLSAVLTTEESQPATIKKSSLTVEDSKSKNKFYDFDDGKGKLGGGDVLAGGTVDYASGKVGLDFKKGKGPDTAKNVEASYSYHELISKDYNLYANHAYIFVKTSGDNLILKNPWGAGDAYEPKPIPGATFVKFFEGIASTSVPAEKSDEKKKTP